MGVLKCFAIDIESQSETVRLKRSSKDLREYYTNLGSGIIISKIIVS